MRRFKLRQLAGGPPSEDEPAPIATSNGSGVRPPETVAEWSARRAVKALLDRQRRIEEKRIARERELLVNASPTAVAWKDKETGDFLWWDPERGNDDHPATKDEPVRTFGMLQVRAAQHRARKGDGGS